MTKVWDKPCAQNLYQQEHVSCLLHSFNHWTGRTLVKAGDPIGAGTVVVLRALCCPLSQHCFRPGLKLRQPGGSDTF